MDADRAEKCGLAQWTRTEEAVYTIPGNHDNEATDGEPSMLHKFIRHQREASEACASQARSGGPGLGSHRCAHDTAGNGRIPDIVFSAVLLDDALDASDESGKNSETFRPTPHLRASGLVERAELFSHRASGNLPALDHRRRRIPVGHECAEKEAQPHSSHRPNDAAQDHSARAGLTLSARNDKRSVVRRGHGHGPVKRQEQVLSRLPIIVRLRFGVFRHGSASTTEEDLLSFGAVLL